MVVWMTDDQWCGKWRKLASRIKWPAGESMEVAPDGADGGKPGSNIVWESSTIQNVWP